MSNIICSSVEVCENIYKQCLTKSKMSFFDLNKKRKTTFEFSGDDVSEKDVLTLLDSARWAPSCTNTQPWQFVVVRDKAKIEQIMKHVNYGFFHTSPPVIIACVLNSKECSGKGKACFIDEKSGVYDAFISVGIAAYNITLQAAEIGIDSCFLTPDQEPVKKLLKIKKTDYVPLLVGLGYEKKGTFQRKKERKELKDILHYEYLGGKKTKKNG